MNTLLTSSPLSEKYPRGSVLHRIKAPDIEHPAIVIGYDLDGCPIVLHNSIDDGRVIRERLDTFANQQKLYRRERPAYDPDLAVRRALLLEGLPYSLVNFNCQHFVNLAIYGKSASPDLWRYGAILTVGVVASILKVVFSDTRYDRNVGRYRDGMGRFARN